MSPRFKAPDLCGSRACLACQKRCKQLEREENLIMARESRLHILPIEPVSPLFSIAAASAMSVAAASSCCCHLYAAGSGDLQGGWPSFASASPSQVPLTECCDRAHLGLSGLPALHHTCLWLAAPLCSCLDSPIWLLGFY